MINCPNCGAGNKPGSSVCRMCATSLAGIAEAPVTREQTANSNSPAAAKPDHRVREEEKTSVEQEGIVCPECQAHNDTGWSFCQQCGKRLPKVEPRPATPRAKEPEGLKTNPEQEAVTEPSLAMKTVDDRAGAQPSFRTVAEKVPVIEPPHREKPFAAPATVVHQVPVSHKAPSAADPQEEISTVEVEAKAKEKRVVPPPPPIPPPVVIPPPAAVELKPPAVAHQPKAGGMPGALCTHCGQSNAVGAAFCASCGTPVTFGKTMVMSSPLAQVHARLHLVMEGGQAGEVYDLTDETIIGRSNGEITFPHDGFMSGRHARIIRRGSSFVLTDEGSRNGTFVKIKGDVELKSGDMILVGKQLFRFEV